MQIEQHEMDYILTYKCEKEKEDLLTKIFETWTSIYIIKDVNKSLCN